MQKVAGTRHCAHRHGQVSEVSDCLGARSPRFSELGSPVLTRLTASGRALLAQGGYLKAFNLTKGPPKVHTTYFTISCLVLVDEWCFLLSAHSMTGEPDGRG